MWGSSEKLKNHTLCSTKLLKYYSAAPEMHIFKIRGTYVIMWVTPLCTYYGTSAYDDGKAESHDVSDQRCSETRGKGHLRPAPPCNNRVCHPVRNRVAYCQHRQAQDSCEVGSSGDNGAY